MPAALPGGLGYDQYRAYVVPTGSGNAKAAVAVGTAPQGGYWDVQAHRLDRRPHPDEPRRDAHDRADAATRCTTTAPTCT